MSFGRPNENFNDVQLGDAILFYSGTYWSGINTCVGKVTKVTAKQFCVGSHRFRKEDGAEIGNTFRHCYHATEKDVEDIKRAKYLRELKNTLYGFFSNKDNLNLLTTEEQEKILEIIKPKLNDNKD